MKKKSLLLFLLILTFSMQSKGFSKGLEQFIPQQQQIEKEADDKYLKTIITGTNQFAFDLYQALKDRRENFIVSPYAVATGLSMLNDGVKNETRTEIQKALHFSLSVTPLLQSINQYMHINAEKVTTSQLSVLAAVWLQKNQSLLPSYKFSLERNFKYSLTPLNFEPLSAALSQINGWMAAQSKRKINQIISYQDLSKDLQLMITTGFYWKGEWAQPFSLKETKKAPFIYRQHSFNVEMMQRTDMYAISKQEDFIVLNIPFKPFQEGGAQLGLTLLLPNENVDLKKVDNLLTIENWYQWIAELKPQFIELFLPKVRLETKSDLADTLKKMGIKSAFDVSADFSGISEQKIHLNKFIDKALLNIGEGGSDVMALRIISSVEKQEELSAESIKFNRPFLFIVQEMTTHLIISIGKIEQP